MSTGIKNHVLLGAANLREKKKDFSLGTPLTQEVQDEIEKLSPEVKKLLKGTLLTRDLAAEGEALFESKIFNHAQFGRMLSQQHEILRDYLHISAP